MPEETTRDVLADLNGFPTVSHDPNRQLINYCAGLLDDVGVDSQIIENDEGSKANLFATIGPADRRGVMLSGHTDVVPVAGQTWTKPAFEATEEDGRIYGRGTADMKGFVASALIAARHAATRELKTPLHLALSYDEEIGCVGVRSLINTLANAPVRPLMCIVGEPTGMRVATGHKGKTAIEAKCIGAEAHSAMAPTAVNAIHLACDLIAEIRNIQDELAANGTKDHAYAVPYTTLHTGLINGGVALNIVPNAAYVKFEIRNLPNDDPEAILVQLKSALEPVIATARERAPQSNIILEVTNSYPGLDTALEQDVFDLVTSLTGGNERIKVAFGTEGGLFSRDLDIPTVICGPGFMDQGHKPNEFVSLDQLASCDAMLAALNERLVTGL